MALLKLGILAGDMSGKVGSHVVSKNKGGMYVRQNRTPVNPVATPQQTVVRAALAALSQNWLQGLTPEQRANWLVYAQNVPYINRLGDSRIMPALAAYVKINGARIQNGLARLDDAPTIFTGTSLTPPFVTALTTGTPGTCIVNIETSDPWNVAGGALYCYASTPQNSTINFWKGPYRLLKSWINGIDTITSTLALTLADDIAGGQRVFFRFFSQTPDGRLSANTLADALNTDIALQLLSVVTDGATPSVLTLTFDQAVINTAGGTPTGVFTNTPSVGANVAVGSTSTILATMDAQVTAGDVATVDPTIFVPGDLTAGYVLASTQTMLVT